MPLWLLKKQAGMGILPRAEMQKLMCKGGGSWTGLGSPLMVCDLQVGMGFKPPRVEPFWTSSLMLVPIPAHRSWGEGARATMPGTCGLGVLLALLLLPMISASRPGTVFRLNKEVLSYGKRCAVRLSAMCVCERVGLGVHACRCVYNPKCTHVSMNSNPMGTWISLLSLCP